MVTPWRLPESEWDAVGIYRHRPSGIPTHVSRGDAHAADIIEGRYPLERAKQDEQRRRALLGQLRQARQPGSAQTGAAWLRRLLGE
ncbi:MAG: hypothetical protein IT179_13495 [Acidobacteria bacterium]|nr:hypothetical protein [Acidobacteriota bacterium]